MIKTNACSKAKKNLQVKKILYTHQKVAQLVVDLERNYETHIVQFGKRIA
jgi:hypothetical protein